MLFIFLFFVLFLEIFESCVGTKDLCFSFVHLFHSNEGGGLAVANKGLVIHVRLCLSGISKGKSIAARRGFDVTRTRAHKGKVKERGLLQFSWERCSSSFYLRFLR